MQKIIQVPYTIRFVIDYMGIEGYHTDYNYLINRVNTEVHKEVDNHNITFHAYYLDELALVEQDVINIILEVADKIEEIEKEIA